MLAVRHDSPWPLFLSIAVSLSLVSPWIFGLFDGTRALEHFRDRAIGSTTLQGIDAAGYARNYVAMTVLLAACLFVVFAAFSRLDTLLSRQVDPRSIAKEYRAILRLSEVSIVLVLMRLIVRDDFPATLGFVLYGFIAGLFGLIACKVLIRRRGQDRGPLAILLEDSPFLVALLFLPMPFVLAFQVVFERPLGFAEVSVATGLSAYLVAVVSIFLVYHAILTRRNLTEAGRIRSSNARLTFSAVPLLFIPLSIPLANELQYSFPDTPPRVVSIGVILVLLLLVPLFFQLHRRRAAAAASSALIGYVYFPLFVATNTVFVLHRHVRHWPALDYFHTGELTVPTQQLFHFGSIPLIDLRLAHTLSDLVYPSLYTWIHGFHGMDMMIWTTWMPPTVALLILYYLLARLVSPAFALLAASLTPLLNTVTTYYSYALVPALFLGAALRRPTVARFCLVWASGVGLTLWRFDFGMVGWAALVLVLAVDLVRRPRRWKTLLTSLGVVAALSLAGLFLVALVSQRPVFETLFLLVKSYAFRFATRTRVDIIGQYSTLALLQYYVLPAVSLVYVLTFAVRRLIRGAYMAPGKYMWVYTAIFSLAISLRSLERHSLVEGYNPYFSVLLLAFMPFFLARTSQGREGAGRRSVFFGVVVLTAAFSLPPSSYARSHVYHLFKGGELFAFHDWDEGSQRVFYNAGRHEDLVRFLVDRLEGDQTFYDFTNSPLLYVFADKKFPIHVIPNIVQTSETVQEDVLADLAALREEQRLPFVVFKQDNHYWDNVDGVPNEVRSYRITEFIYRNYVPFAVIGRYQVWIDKSHEDPESLWDGTLEAYPLEFSSRPQWNAMARLPGSGAEEVSFRAQGGDSYVFSLFELDELPPLDTHPHWELLLRYRSSVSGRLQVYYSLDGSVFEEKTSVGAEIVETPAAGEAEVRVPLPAAVFVGRLTDLRFDPPAGSEFTFIGAVVAGSEIRRRRITDTDLSQSFPLAQLPYTWGRHDPLNAAEKTPVQAVLLDRPTLLAEKDELVFPLDPHLGKAAGTYLHLRARPVLPVAPDSREDVPRLAIEYGAPVAGSFDLELSPASTTVYRRDPLRRAQDPVMHHVESFDVGDRVIFKSVGDDPYVHRVFDFAGLDPLSRDADTFLALDYRSVDGGELQVFFGLNWTWFEPRDSVTVEIGRTSENGRPGRIVLPLSFASAGSGSEDVRLTDLRFDFPLHTLFEVVGAEVIRYEAEDADYLVRLSTQWAWTSQDVRELTLRASGRLVLEEVVLRKGD